MRNSGLILIALVFFFIVNTTYYWETKIGALVFPAFLFLVLIYLILIIVLIRQLILLFGEKPASKIRLLKVILLIAVLVLTGYKPSGLIDFEKIDTSSDLLIARREGTASCSTVFRLKQDSGFTIRDICFGVTETVGKYHIVNDTIYLTYGQNIKWKDLKYRFAVIEEAEHYTDHPLVLKLYKHKQDTSGYRYFITKNNLGIQIKKPVR